MKNVFIYVRVSTQEQAKDGYSIDEQIERLKEYCKALQWTILKIYTDAGYSGATTDRPALKEMICDIKKGICDLVVVYKLDRLSRSQKDTLSLIEDCFLKNHVDFISMTENFDTSSPFGRAMIGILSVFAQLEREQIKERMGMGKEGRAKDGRWHRGRTSYLGSLLYCKQCGARYSAYIVRDKKHNASYSYYTCYSRRKSARNMIIDPNCKNKIYRRDELDKIIFDEISKLANDPTYIHELKQDSYPDEMRQKESLIQKEIEKIETQKSRFMDLYGLGEFSAQEIQKKVAPLNEQKQNLLKELSILKADESDLAENDAVELVRTWSDVLEKGSFDQIRMLINALIERIEIDGDDIDIFWKFA